ENLRGVIAKRLEVLTRTARDVLVAAASVGPEFESSLVCEVTQITEERLLELAPQWLDAGLVARVGRSRWLFTHPLIQESLYNETVDSTALHHRIVEALEHVYSDDLTPHLAELAHHCRLGGDDERAIHYSIRAAAAAGSIYAYDQEISHLRVAK